MKKITNTVRLKKDDAILFCECLETVARFSVGQTEDLHYFFTYCLSPELTSKTKAEIIEASRALSEASRNILFYGRFGHDFNQPFPKMLMGIRAVILNGVYAGDEWKPSCYPYWHDKHDTVTITKDGDWFVIGFGGEEMYSVFGVVSALYDFAILYKHESLADWVSICLPCVEQNAMSGCCDALIKAWVDLLEASYGLVEEPGVEERRFWSDRLFVLERLRSILKDTYQVTTINEANWRTKR